MTQCLLCDGGPTEKREEIYSFLHGPVGNRVLLTTPVPVIYCPTCGEMLTDNPGYEEAIDAAVARYVAATTGMKV